MQEGVFGVVRLQVIVKLESNQNGILATDVSVAIRGDLERQASSCEDGFPFNCAGCWSRVGGN